jgi:hypothetical protein
MKHEEDIHELVINDLTGLSDEAIANINFQEGEFYLVDDTHDDVPIPGSKKLVTSDGIYKGLSLRATRHVFYVEITTEDWSLYAPYTKTIPVPNMLSTDDEFGVASVVHGNTPELRSAQDTGFSLISMIKSNDGSITITCDNEVPTIPLTISLKVVR